MYYSIMEFLSFNKDYLTLYSGAAFTAVSLYLWIDRWRRRERGRVQVPAGVSYNKQSIPVDAPEEDGKVMGSIFLAESEDGLIKTPDKKGQINTFYDVFLKGVQRSGNGECLGYRPDGNSGYVWKSYGQVLEEGKNFGSGLINLGLKPGQDTFIGIFGQNSIEWVVGSIGAVTQSMVIVPLYDTLGADACTFIINQSGMELILCDSDERAAKILENIDQTPSVQCVIVVDKVHPKAQKAIDNNQNGVKLVLYEDVLDSGAKHPKPLTLPRKYDLYIICYTSGTTGQPKGVMLTHGNVVSNMSVFPNYLKRFQMSMLPGQSVIGYLPLAHMFQQSVQLLAFNMGCKIGFFRGSVTGLLDDIKVLKPDFFPVVPRLLNRLYDRIHDKLNRSGPLAKFIFNMAYKAKLAELNEGIIRKDSIWDRLVFKKLQAELGGNVKIMVTGSAPIAPEVLETCRVCLGALLLEGYGQTECTAIATICLPGDNSAGHVGGVANCCHIKLVDVPELGYWTKEGKGEICIKGHCVTQGYFRDEEKTKEILDESGWLHTGDVGMWLPAGTLKVIDRKKHIFKLAQGEYVAPEKIEAIYTRDPLISQIFVDGDSLQRYLVAIVVPEASALKYWYSNNNPINDSPSLEDICADPNVKSHILKQMTKLGKDNGLNSIELVKNIFLDPVPFSLERGLLTPTMKSKRPQLRKYYANSIQQLYKEIK